MNWQIKYALEYFAKTPGRSKAEFLKDDLIKITTDDQPDVLAAILPNEMIDEVTARRCRRHVPELDFLCGYRVTCVWTGGAIQYLENNSVGWGNFGTLLSAASEGNANTASHKVYRFPARLLGQLGSTDRIEREFDRVHRVFLKDGRIFRVGMISEYEPTADAVRSLWERVGPLDVVWNINPNGRPSFEAVAAGRELGCEVVKWEELKERLSKA